MNPIKSVNDGTSIINSMNERNLQAKMAQTLRQQNSDSTHSSGFLHKFNQCKLSIMNDLNAKVDIVKTESLDELTKFLDDILVRIQNMQSWLNETSLYLKAFDSEHAGLELKNLNTFYQSKRQELLPKRKFNFTPKPKMELPALALIPNLTKDLEIKNPVPNTQINPSFEYRFSLVNVRGPCDVVIPQLDETNLTYDSQSLLTETVYLADLSHCTIRIEGVFGNIMAQRLSHCCVYAYPVAGSVWLEDCTHCDLVFACRQLRVHETSNCRLSLHVASKPIVETSTSLKIAPYQLSYPTLNDDLMKAGISTESNLWQEIKDFSCPNKRLIKGSSNWYIMPESEWFTLQPK